MFDVERATDLKVLQPSMGTKHKASQISHGSGALGENTPRPFHDWGLEGVSNKA